MEARYIAASNNSSTGRSRNGTHKRYCLAKRGASLDTPRNSRSRSDFNEYYDEEEEEKASSNKRFSEPQVKSDTKSNESRRHQQHLPSMDRHDRSGDGCQSYYNKSEGSTSCNSRGDQQHLFSSSKSFCAKSVRRSDESQAPAAAGCHYKQTSAQKLRTEVAVPTFSQKLSLAHKRRLGMAKQWSMDETQSWFRERGKGIRDCIKEGFTHKEAQMHNYSNGCVFG